MFHVCNTGETAHIDTIFKFLPHTRQLMLTRVWLELEYFPDNRRQHLTRLDSSLHFLFR